MSDRLTDLITIPALMPIALLLLSNVFMTFAWYWHLKLESSPLIAIILISWGIAFFEYCLAVPANRIGYGFYTASELRTIQLILSLTIFSFFAYFYLGEKISITHIVGFILIGVGAYLVFSASSTNIEDKTPTSIEALSPPSIKGTLSK